MTYGVVNYLHFDELCFLTVSIDYPHQINFNIFYGIEKIAARLK